jgi:hypothetical protein
MRSATSSTAELIAAEAGAESPLWGEALRAEPDWEPVFSPLADERYAAGLETVYEAYLVHYGRSRLFAPPDGDVAILLGDYLYAHGLVRIAAAGGVPAVSILAGLVSRCAALRAAGRPGDGEAWADAARELGGGDGSAEARAQALAVHRARLLLG